MEANQPFQFGFLESNLYTRAVKRDMCLSLIQNGINVNSQNEDLLTALHICTRRGWTEISTLLIKNGANVNAKSATGHTPLHFAVERNFDELQGA